MISRFLAAVLAVFMGQAQINALNPGDSTVLSPGRFNEGNRHYTFFITVTRDSPPQPPSVSTASTVKPNG